MPKSKVDGVAGSVWCDRCGRRAKLVPHYCIKCTKRTPKQFKSAKQASKSFLSRFPTLAVVQDMEEGSQLQELRHQCLVTGSKAGVLWNAKRGQSFLNWLEVKLGEATEQPFSDYGKQLMAAGRRMEPLIAQYFWGGLFNEYKATFGEAEAHENLMWVHPGMAMQKVGKAVVGATPDGLVNFYDGEHFRMVVVEIKYYASKATIPDAIPADYIAQILLQMTTCGTDVCLFLCRVGEVESETFWEWRVLRCLPAHKEALREKIEWAECLVAGQRRRQSEGDAFNYPKRFPNETAELERMGSEMEVARGDTFAPMLATLLREAPHALLIK